MVSTTTRPWDLRVCIHWQCLRVHFQPQVARKVCRISMGVLASKEPFNWTWRSIALRIIECSTRIRLDWQPTTSGFERLRKRWLWVTLLDFGSRLQYASATSTPTSLRLQANACSRGSRESSLEETIVIWLILPVVICSCQRLSHACLSISNCTVKLRMAH